MEHLSGKRLVIFGCGYVGGAIARRAAGAGLRVTALTRNPVTAEALRAEGINTVVADLASDGWHGEVEGETEFAINCVSSGGGGEEAYRHSYVAGMESVLSWGRERGFAGTLIYTSSTSVYGQGGGVTVDETMPTTATTERAEILIAAETRLRAAGAHAGRVFILRLAGIYGPGRCRLIEEVRTGQVAGAGDRHLNLIHRDDIVAAVAACLAASGAMPDGIFNVVDDGRASKAQIVAWLAAELGLPPPRFTGEAGAGRRPVPPDRVMANGKLKTQLGWRPRYPTFREGYASLLSR